MIIFFQIFPYGPPYGFFIHPLVPQRKQEKLAKVSLWPKCLWPKCHSGQSVTGQNVTGQSDTGQTVSLAKVSLANVSLAKRSLWPKCHSGQSVLAKVSLAKVSFWPKCNSAKRTDVWSRPSCIYTQIFSPVLKHRKIGYENQILTIFYP